MKRITIFLICLVLGLTAVKTASLFSITDNFDSSGQTLEFNGSHWYPVVSSLPETCEPEEVVFHDDHQKHFGCVEPNVWWEVPVTDLHSNFASVWTRNEATIKLGDRLLRDLRESNQQLREIEAIEKQNKKSKKSKN